MEKKNEIILFLSLYHEIHFLLDCSESHNVIDMGWSIKGRRLGNPKVARKEKNLKKKPRLKATLRTQISPCITHLRKV